MFYYLFEVFRDRTHYEVVVRSAEPVEPFEYRSEWKLGDHSNITRLYVLAPTVVSTSGEMWKYGDRYVIANSSEITAMRDRFYELSGYKVSLTRAHVHDTVRGEELTAMSDRIEAELNNKKELERTINEKRNQLLELERKHQLATERVSEAHSVLQHWQEPMPAPRTAPWVSPHSSHTD